MNPSIEMKSPATPFPAAPRGITGNAPSYVPRRGRAGNEPAPARVASERDRLAASAPVSSRPAPTPEAVSAEWPTSYELYLAARSRRAFVLGELLAAMVQAVASAARRLLVRYRDHRRAAEAREALRQLDDRTLHDIGIDRSEIASITAEWAGQAERSRRQIAAMSGAERSSATLERT